MIPTYRNIESYPFHRNHIPFPHPHMEPVPPQMIIDPSKSSFPYEQPWPYPCNYGHTIPPHFCYGHHNFPSYIPSYPHVPSPSPMYCFGGCPSFGESNFAPYSPQSHYTTMDLPRYEYDKYMPKGHHSCGRPNPVSNQRKEDEPDVVGKKENDGMVPIQFRNFPYPLVWIPPEYYGNKQPKNHTKPEFGEQDKMSNDKKSNGSENGLLPVKGAPNMFGDEDGKRCQKKEPDNNIKEFENGRMEQKHESEQKRSEFPFPFIWLPYYNHVPVKSCVDEGVTERTRSNDVGSGETGDSDVSEKVSNQRSILVKQANDLKQSEKSEMNVLEENVTRKDSTSMNKRRSVSPPKGSNLPPVCLRVEPLPKKKYSNGSSRSPSPPVSKEHSKATAGETNKNPSKASEEVTPKVKTIQVSQNKTNENKGADECNKEKEAENMTGEAAEHSIKDANTRTNGEGKRERSVLSDIDASVLIQAAYRGYLVRKWEPLKKLRQIAEVSKDVTYVRGQIQAFEDSYDLQNDSKQKVTIGEIIMRLLLKLDTIQGLHPSLREIRKSLARELVTLQERLDSITAKNPQQQTQEFNAKETVEVSPLNVQNAEHILEQQEEKVAIPKDSSEDNSDRKIPEDQFCMKNDQNNVCYNDSRSEDISSVVGVDATDANDSAINAMKELPVGVLDEDTETSEFRKDEETNISKSEVQADNEVFIEELPIGLFDEDAEKSECNAKDRTSFSTANTAEDNHIEQPLVEEEKEVQCSEESDGWVKIEFQKEEDELKVNAPMDIEELKSLDHLNEEAYLKENDVANILLEPNEKDADGKLAQQETQVHVQDTVVGEKTSGDDKNTIFLAKEELNGDMKLLEENEKLRKLMKELLEAGNEQLSVITNLTGRVKDLEKKLAKTRRSKKVRTKRHRSVTPKMSCSNCSK